MAYTSNAGMGRWNDQWRGCSLWPASHPYRVGVGHVDAHDPRTRLGGGHGKICPVYIAVGDGLSPNPSEPVPPRPYSHSGPLPIPSDIPRRLADSVGM
ncbi:hypothetical protein GmHk_04G010522 [Glycine max]|nr:hypothetical protein GmHk_04G010522 [Glycine max]